jgi:SAM-dependent methyltransferase
MLPTNLKNPNWDQLATIPGLAPVLDPRDKTGTKNALMDRMHWLALKSRIKPAEQLLDFGCGVGRFAQRIRQTGSQYTGVDRSLEMVRSAVRNTNGMGTKFAQFDGLHLPFPDAYFTVCICCFVLQYHSKTSSANTMLQEMHRVLKPGGRLLLLEQVSRSGQKSETVAVSSTEEDFRSQILDLFEVKNVLRVRASYPTRIARPLLNGGPWMRKTLPVVAKLESLAIQSMGPKRISKLPYYDVLFETVKRPTAASARQAG